MLGLVGESGSGKSTVGNCVVRLLEPTEGTIRLKGRDITHTSRRELRPLRREMHIVFQDPYSSLNPRMTCGEIVGEPLRIQRLARGRAFDARGHGAVRQSGPAAGASPPLPARAVRRTAPARGPRARAVGVARRSSIADEPVSALDVSVQAAILNLLRELQHDMGFSCLFITHDLATVEYLCDRVAVMYLGQIVETARTADLFAAPKHPYTQALLSAAVVPDPAVQRTRTRVVLDGDIPSPARAAVGLPFPHALPARAANRPLVRTTKSRR